MSKVLMTALFILTVFGCSKTYKYVQVNQEFSKKAQYRDLLTQASRYWDALSIKDFDESYEYELPYLNFKHNLEWYKKFHSNNKEKYFINIKSIKSIDLSGVVYIELEYNKNGKTFTFLDKWIDVNGRWYHKYSDSLVPDIDEP